MRILTFIQGVAVGAAIMYFCDPDRGKRRRAQVRDQANHLTNRLGKTLDAAARDFTNRTNGVVAEVQSLFTIESPTDIRIVERVRARLGHVLAQPSKIRISARYGVVTLGGSVPVSEVSCLLHCVTHTRGVVGVRNELLTSYVPGADPENMGEVMILNKRNSL